MEAEKKGTPKTASKKSRSGVRSVDIYAAQCETCFKWRVIPTLEEYEELRSKLVENPFVCEKKPGVSCKDDADLDYDSTRTWAIDKPSIPKTPEGFQRTLCLRGDFSKMDAYYITPTGKKLRTRNEIASFLEENPDYDVPLSSFTFSVPKIMCDTFPQSGDKKKVSSSGGGGGEKKVSTSGRKRRSSQVIVSTPTSSSGGVGENKTHKAA